MKGAIAGLVALFVGGCAPEYASFSTGAYLKTWIVDTECNVSRRDFVKAISSWAERRHEFQIIYVPEDEKLRNVTKRASAIDFEYYKDMFDEAAASGKEFYLVHNHIGRIFENLESQNLGWIVPSQIDIRDYMNGVCDVENVTYGVVTKYGLLTIDGTCPYEKVDEEVKRMSRSLKGVGIWELERWAENYKGLLKLKFEHK